MKFASHTARRRACAIFCGVFCGVTLAAPGVTHAGAGIDAFEHFFREVQTFEAKFTQVVLDENLSAIDDGEGSVQIKRPGRFRWDYTPPDAQEIVGDGSRIWQHDIALEQITVHDQAASLARTPAMLLAGKEFPKDSYQIEELGRYGSIDWVNLIPQDLESGFSEIRLGFAGQQLQQLELVDTLDRHTRISFSAVRENAPLDDSVFTFEAPPGADIIDQTSQ